MFFKFYSLVLERECVLNLAERVLAVLSEQANQWLTVGQIQQFDKEKFGTCQGGPDITLSLQALIDQGKVRRQGRNEYEYQLM